MTYTFRACWPIVDPTMTYADLCREALADVPRLAAQAHARTHGVGRFVVAPSDIVAGSGRITATCLVYIAQATPIVRPTSILGGREPTYDTPDHQACGRCGVVRKVCRSKVNPRGDLCRDCMSVEAQREAS